MKRRNVKQKDRGTVVCQAWKWHSKITSYKREGNSYVEIDEGND